MTQRSIKQIPGVTEQVGSELHHLFTTTEDWEKSIYTSDSQKGWKAENKHSNKSN